jgi:hypothetical protein
MIDQNELISKWLTKETFTVSGELESTIEIDISDYAIQCIVYYFEESYVYMNVNFDNMEIEIQNIFDRLQTHPLFEPSILRNLDNVVTKMSPLEPFRRSHGRLAMQPSEKSKLFDKIFFEGAAEYVSDLVEPIFDKIKTDNENNIKSLLANNAINKKLLGLK